MTDARRYFVRTFGCQMNEHDSERIAGLLEADGLEQATSVEEADVVVLNTCCIRENADNKLYGTLGHLKSLKDRRPGMQIMVGGCLAQKDRDVVVERAGHVDVVFGTHNVHRAVDLLHEAGAAGRPVVEILEETVAEDHETFPSALPVRREVPWAGWVTIQIGCDNSCAFCIVPAVRGKEISRPFADVVREVEVAAADGVTEVTLLGQNVNSYGRDLALAARQAGEDVRVRPMFSELLRAVGAVEGIRRVRYTSPHPKDLRPETIAAMAETPEVCEHLHLPLQSGSDRVLSAMHRGYTAERYLERLAAARAAIEDLAVTTDIIVGFPGETDDDFERTLEVAAEAAYDSAYTFIYSPRPGTEAAERTEEYVPAEVVAERFERLRIVVERSGLAKHEARVGRDEEVLVEGPSRKDPAVLTGRTRQNKLVHFASDRPIKAGSYATVRVTSAAPHHLRGDLLEVTASATHRTRLPLLVG
ncbi:MAG: tRNA (N6-isopentenyl adenosine(37)-C2)-methylthiotransferase MiaB [Actinomycetota bacterium]